MPRLNGCTITLAPAVSARAAVVSVEPSSITSTSNCGHVSRIVPTTQSIDRSSLYAGTIASLRTPERGSAPLALSTVMRSERVRVDGLLDVIETRLKLVQFASRTQHGLQVPRPGGARKRMPLRVFDRRPGGGVPDQRRRHRDPGLAQRLRATLGDQAARQRGAAAQRAAGH